jgi:predicted DNA-binding WGR domain protein
MARYERSKEFWQIERLGEYVHVVYGRIGTPGRRTRKRHRSDAEAQAAMDVLVAEKLRKGYAIAVWTSPHGAVHSKAERRACSGALEAWIARASDVAPACTSPLVRTFVWRWTWRLGKSGREDVASRIDGLVGSAASRATELGRAWRALDWLVRVHTVACLEHAGRDALARELARLPRIRATNARAALRAVRASGTALARSLRASPSLGTRSGSKERVLDVIEDAVSSIVSTAFADDTWRASYDAEVWRDRSRRVETNEVVPSLLAANAKLVGDAIACAAQVAQLASAQRASALALVDALFIG